MYLLENNYQIVNMSKKKILVVDDDLALQNLICRFFSYNDYVTESAYNGKEARKMLIKFKPDLVILDVNLPDDTGINLCSEISKSNTIVVMLSSMSDPNYILDAFEKGADDYIVKPFNLQILKAKIAALLRRNTNVVTTHNSVHKPLDIGDLSIDFSRREASFAGRVISLTALEFDILYFLASNPNRVWDRAELIGTIWNSNDYSGDDRKVDIHVGRIRRKIGDKEGKLIRTIWGRGYMFELPSS